MLRFEGRNDQIVEGNLGGAAVEPEELVAGPGEGMRIEPGHHVVAVDEPFEKPTTARDVVVVRAALNDWPVSTNPEVTAARLLAAADDGHPVFPPAEDQLVSRGATTVPARVGAFPVAIESYPDVALVGGGPRVELDRHVGGQALLQPDRVMLQALGHELTMVEPRGPARGLPGGAESVAVEGLTEFLADDVVR